MKLIMEECNANWINFPNLLVPNLLVPNLRGEEVKIYQILSF